MKLHTRENEEKEDKKRGSHDHNEREIEEDNRDRLSGLSDCILIHILLFLKAEDAVRTCILSLRWQHLWKQLPSITLNSSDFRTFEGFVNFMNGILTLRDFSIALNALDFKLEGTVEAHVLESIKLFGSHLSSIQQVRIDVYDAEESITILNWLKEMTNIKSLTVTPKTLKALSLFPDMFKLKLTSWCKLKSLKLSLNLDSYRFFFVGRRNVNLALAGGKSWKENAKLREIIKAGLGPIYSSILD